MSAEDDQALLLQDQEHRARAREHLLDLVTYCWPEYVVNWHHRLLADALTRFAKGLVKRLLICVPPQTGKSTLISRYLPPFLFGRDPDTKVLGASNARDLARDMSADVLQILANPAYQSVFPDVHVGGRADNGRRARNSALQWELLGPEGPRGSYRGLARGATSAGFPGKWALVDDPFRGSEDAASPTIRKKAWRWFLDDISNRVGAAGHICVTHTAWHMKDIRGMIKELADAGIEEWEIIELPARLDNPAKAHPLDPRRAGDPLWEWFYAGKEASDGMTDKERHAAAQKFLKAWERKSPYGFASLGQQVPVPEGGQMFPIDRIQIVESVAAERVKTVRYWDNAGTDASENPDSDYTAGAKLSELDDGTFLIEHMARGQWAELDRERKKKAIAARDGIGVEIYVEQEPGSSGKDVARATVRNLAGYIVTIDKVTGKKEVRAKPFASAVQAGAVKMLKAPWNKELLDELEYWPNGSHRDQGDALSGAFSKLTDDEGYSLEGMARP